jgi:hypothetical protein
MPNAGRVDEHHGSAGNGHVAKKNVAIKADPTRVAARIAFPMK